jgi:hypothetical protein
MSEREQVLMHRLSLRERLSSIDWCARPRRARTLSPAASNRSVRGRCTCVPFTEERTSHC